MQEKSSVTDFDKLWDYSKPEETNKKFTEILPEVKASGNKSAYLELLTQIARTMGLQMKFDEAHKVLDEVETLLTDDLTRAKIRFFLEKGRLLNSSKKNDRGKEFFLKAYDLSLKTKDDDLGVDAAHMLGIIETAEESLNWNETAMKLAENSSDKKAVSWLGTLYNNTGWTYHDMGDYDKALSLFEKNVKWHTEKKSISELLIARWCVARTLRSLNRVDESLIMQLDLLNEYRLKNLPDDGYVFEELGELYLLKGNNDESKKYFSLAFQELSKDIFFVEYEKERLERIKESGGL